MASKKESANAKRFEDLKLFVLLIGALLGVISWSTGAIMLSIPIVIGIAFLFLVFWRLNEGQENYSET